MKVTVEPGTYVLAVSGGVDSVVLLDILRQQADVKLVVAHFDHGIRPDASTDRQFVQRLAARYGLECKYEEGRLGSDASEATARQARYAFLGRVRQASGAQAIMTAHHQDDVLETAIINLLRGTGRHGLSSLQDTAELRRPLLGVPKHELLLYARAHHLEWHEDSTNQEVRYLRNYVRQRLLARFDTAARERLVGLIQHTAYLNARIDSLLADCLVVHAQNGQLSRKQFSGLPHAVAGELLLAWFRSEGVASIDRRATDRLVIAAKISRAGSRLDIKGGAQLQVTAHRLALTMAER